MKKNELILYFYQFVGDGLLLRIVAIVLYKLCLLGAALFPAYFTKLIFDDILPSLDLQLLALILLAMLAFSLISAIFEYYFLKFHMKTFNILVKRTRDDFISKMLNRNLRKFDQFSSGDIIYRGSQDISKVSKNAYNMLIDGFVNIFYFILISIILIKINMTLAVISICLILGKTLYNLLISKKYNYLNDNAKESDANLLNILKQLIDRYLFIKLNRLEKIEEDRYRNFLEKMIYSGERIFLFRAFHGSFTSLISIIMQMTIICVGAFFISSNIISIGLLLSFMNIVQKINAPIEYISNLFFTYKDLMSSYLRIKPLINQSYSKKETIIESSKTDIHLECRNIHLEISSKPILTNFNLVIRRNEKVAVIGKSGTGKSSLCKLLAGVFLYEGEVIIHIDKNSNKPMIGFILEECSLFNGPLREILTYGCLKPFISDHEIVKSIYLASLTDFLNGLPDGLDTYIYLNRLSHGEKQRLEIARIILIRPQLIILDEAISGLDKETRNQVWSNIREACSESTIVYTTHDYEIIYSEDEVINIDSEIKEKMSLRSMEPYVL